MVAWWHMELLGQGSDLSRSCQLKWQLQQCRILNPLFWAGDQTLIPVFPRHCPSCCVTVGAPINIYLCHVSWPCLHETSSANNCVYNCYKRGALGICESKYLTFPLTFPRGYHSVSVDIMET